jgi:NitT/TauT family transport system ATP-binding protein
VSVTTDPSLTGVAVEVQDLTMHFVKESQEILTALDSVSFRVMPSSVCSIVGPSGCGKSTLLMLIAGLFEPTSGRILLNGEPIGGTPPRVGMVFQRDVLLEWRTALQNVLLPIEVLGLPLGAYRERAQALLRLVGLEGFEHEYPDRLSGGMRQRVAICRAIIHEPALLLMDEPFAAVDALTRERLNLDLLRLLAASFQTVLLVTHSIEEAVFLSDQLIVMGPRPGKVLRSQVIELPKPRTLETRSHPEFHRLVDEIRRLFHSMGNL